MLYQLLDDDLLERTGDDRPVLKQKAQNPERFLAVLTSAHAYFAHFPSKTTNVKTWR
jgi:hypothetical protein